MGDNLEADLLELLNPSTRADVRGVAVQQVLGMTGSKEGCAFITQHGKLLECLLQLLADKNPHIAKEAVKIMTNLTAEESAALALLQPSLELSMTEAMTRLLEQCLDPATTDTSLCCVLTNLTRVADCARFVARVVMESEEERGGLAKFVQRLGDLYNKKSPSFSAVSTVLMNLTQVPCVRRGLMVPPDRLLMQLLPIISVSSSLSACKAIIGTVQNCCFEYDFHDWLLGEGVDLLPRLLLPLAGPEEFDEDDMEKLPLDLQYLPDTKERERDPEVRNMLIKSIHKLCSTKVGRRFVKEKNTYVVLRELHKWEKNEENGESIHNVIDILISDEPEAGMEDLHSVKIPSHVEEKFEQGS
ncbi:protein HGH1 homolog [Babylonia areolata]|uniref:protein HGH1 homolog n=1 Tax=Babylonia areolata TaxID=304850 RepID=UPI003FCF0B79